MVNINLSDTFTSDVLMIEHSVFLHVRRRNVKLKCFMQNIVQFLHFKKDYCDIPLRQMIVDENTQSKFEAVTSQILYLCRQK